MVRSRERFFWRTGLACVTLGVAAVACSGESGDDQNDNPVARVEPATPAAERATLKQDQICQEVHKQLGRHASMASESLAYKSYEYIQSSYRSDGRRVIPALQCTGTVNGVNMETNLSFPFERPEADGITRWGGGSLVWQLANGKNEGVNFDSSTLCGDKTVVAYEHPLQNGNVYATFGCHA